MHEEEKFHQGIINISRNNKDFFEGGRPIISCFDLHKDEITGRYSLSTFIDVPDKIKYEIYELYLSVFDESLRN